MTIANSKWTKLLTGAAKFLPEAPWVAIVVELVSQLAAHMGDASGDSKESLKHVEALHAELSQITAAHAGLSQQLSEQANAFAQQSAKLDALSTELHLTQRATSAIQSRLTAVESRFTALETRVTRTFAIALVSCVLTSACLILLVLFLVHPH
jgi:t-SNARE complex subunit (syntaxin)